MYAQYVVLPTTENNHHQFAQSANNQPQNLKRCLTKKRVLRGSKK